MILIFFLFFFSAMSAKEIELFCDFAWEAKGQSMFPLEGENLPLTSQIRRKLLEKGDDIRSWELDVYRPLLLTWKGVKNFEDFKHWLGIGIDKKKIVLPTTKYWMFWNLGPMLYGCDFEKVPKEKMVLVMWEPPSVQEELYDPKTQALFGKIFTWDDDLVDNQKFFKIHYPALNPRIPHIVPFEEKKFCVMIARRLASAHPKELYSERKRAIQFFEGKPVGVFDLFGHHWKKKKVKNYQGPLQNKLEKLKEYKFSICYENTGDVRGYISEKIFDCFTAGVVPIYLGASNVTDYIPEGCFIDKRKFRDYEELYQFLKAMTKEEYQVYLDQAEAFLKSEQAKIFTDEYFIESLLAHLDD